MRKLTLAFAALSMALASSAASNYTLRASFDKERPLMLKDSTKSDKWNLDNHILFGVSTGALGGNRYRVGDNTSLKAPLLITGERSGKFGRLTNLPNWLYYGFYFRYSRHEYKYTIFNNPYSITATVIGAGARANVSVLTMAKDLGWGVETMSRIDPYVGFQLGYDVISYDYSNYYYNNYSGGWAYGSGLRLTPMMGVRFFPTHWLGIQAELGGTSTRFLSAGIVIRT